MKKVTVYSRLFEDKGIKGKNWKVATFNGYSDGVFRYYKTPKGWWYAIDPDTGLAMGSARYTRKEAVDWAYKNLDKLKEYKVKHPDSTREFGEAIMEGNVA